MAYCNWDLTSEENKRYHDREWGRPLHDDKAQFEFLSMEVMQCGLSWGLMIKKREIFRQCFDGFDFEKIAGYDEEDIKKIMDTPGMIRSERKIKAIINNARCFIKIRKEQGSFSSFIWDFCGGKTILYNKHEEGFIPASNGLSDALGKELKKRGFKYVGAVTVYSHLQACGIINDHDKSCPCYREINENYPTVKKRRYLEKDVRFYG